MCVRSLPTILPAQTSSPLTHVHICANYQFSLLAGVERVSPKRQMPMHPPRSQATTTAAATAAAATTNNSWRLPTWRTWSIPTPRPIAPRTSRQSRPCHRVASRAPFRLCQSLRRWTRLHAVRLQHYQLHRQQCRTRLRRCSLSVRLHRHRISGTMPDRMPFLVSMNLALTLRLT